MDPHPHKTQPLNTGIPTGPDRNYLDHRLPHSILSRSLCCRSRLGSVSDERVLWCHVLCLAISDAGERARRGAPLRECYRNPLRAEWPLPLRIAEAAWSKRCEDTLRSIRRTCPRSRHAFKSVIEQDKLSCEGPGIRIASLSGIAIKQAPAATSSGPKVARASRIETNVGEFCLNRMQIQVPPPVFKKYYPKTARSRHTCIAFLLKAHWHETHAMTRV